MQYMLRCIPTTYNMQRPCSTAAKQMQLEVQGVGGGGGHSTTLGLAGGGLSSMWQGQSSGSIIQCNLVAGHRAHTVT